MEAQICVHIHSIFKSGWVVLLHSLYFYVCVCLHSTCFFMFSNLWWFINQRRHKCVNRFDEETNLVTSKLTKMTTFIWILWAKIYTIPLPSIPQPVAGVGIVCKAALVKFYNSEHCGICRMYMFVSFNFLKFLYFLALLNFFQSSTTKFSQKFFCFFF